MTKPLKPCCQAAVNEYEVAMAWKCAFHQEADRTTRDLAIARAVQAYAHKHNIWSEDQVLEIIAEVDASLGGVRDSAQDQDVVQNVPETGHDKQLSALLHSPAQAAEPPSDLMSNLHLTPEQSVVLDEWSRGYARGSAEAKREAVGLIRGLLAQIALDETAIGVDPLETANLGIVVDAAKYIATYEAEQAKGEG